MKDDTLQRNNTGFPSTTGSPYCIEMPTFSALIKNNIKILQCKISCIKKLHLCTYEILLATRLCI